MTARTPPTAGPDLIDLLPAGKIPAGFLPVLQAYDYAGDEVTLVHADDDRLRRMAVFDVLINNADRKGGHVLSGVDGNVYGVDHGVTLHVEDKLRTVLWGWSGKPVDDDTLEAVAGLGDALGTDLGAELCCHITPREVAALRARVVAPAEKSGDADSRPAAADTVAGLLTWCTCAVTLTDAALAAVVAAEAGELLLAMREQIGFYDPYDLGDAGDKRANTLILDRLHRERPHDSVLSEEAVDDVSRVDADRVWIVDPVDGTHEYSMPGRADWAVHIALWQRAFFRVDRARRHHRCRGRAACPRRGVPHRHRDRRRRRAPTARSASPPARTGRPRCCGGCVTSSTSSWSGSGRRAPRRWRWSAATSTPTSTPAVNGSGIRRPPPGCCGRPACTRPGSTAPRWSTTAAIPTFRTC